MTINKQRIKSIRLKLEKALSPSFIEIADESHHHIGHAGAASGAGHFALTIQAQSLQGLSRVKSHQAIYAALDDMMPNDIHALKIKIIETK